MYQRLFQFVIAIICLAGIGVSGAEYSAERALSKGIILLEQNRLLDARSTLETVRCIDPAKRSRVHLYLGQTLAGLENYSGAATYLEQGLSGIQSDKFYFLLGKMHERSLKFDKAIRAYKNSIEYNPLFSAPRNALVEIFLDRARGNLDHGGLDKAREEVSHAFQYSTLRRDNFLLAGQIELADHQTAQAARWFEQGLRYHPGDYDLNLQALAAAMNLQQYDKAMDIIRIMYLCPDPGIRDTLITHLFSMTYESVQADVPRILLAYLLLEKGNRTMACSLVRDIEATDPSPDLIADMIRCDSGRINSVKPCDLIKEPTFPQSLYFRFVDLYQRRCQADMSDRFRQLVPAQLLYRPVLFGNLYHKVLLLGYTLPDGAWHNPERFEMDLFLMSVTDIGENAGIRFRFEKPEKKLFINPEIPVVPDYSWRAYETRRITCSLKIPETFKHDNFMISVSFASPEIRKLYAREQMDVGFVPLFKTTRSGRTIMIEPITGEI